MCLRLSAADVPLSKSEFVYDFASRKAVSREFTYTAGAWQQTDEKRRVFDGLDVVQERNSANEVTAQLVRDGNVGGILARSNVQGATFFGYDGGGNVTLLTDANGDDVGRYRYDAFGNTLEAVGSRAAENPYRFSTKELHAASGLYDFGFRFYSAGLGRWINRDPIGEAGGVNLYAMVHNNPVNAVDLYGLATRLIIKFTPAVPGSLRFYGEYGATPGSAANYLLVHSYHATIVVQEILKNKNGAWIANERSCPRFFRGGFQDSKGAPSTTNKVVQGYFLPGSIDWKNFEKEGGRIYIDLPDLPFSQALVNLRSVSRDINRSPLVYKVVTDNSNAIASTLLSRGFGLSPSPPVNAPGWGIDVVERARLRDFMNENPPMRNPGGIY